MPTNDMIWVGFFINPSVFRGGKRGLGDGVDSSGDELSVFIKRLSEVL